MSAKLYFLEANDDGQCRWVLFNWNNNVEYSDYFENKAVMYKNVIHTLKQRLTLNNLEFNGVSAEVEDYIRRRAHALFVAQHPYS